MCLLGSVLCRDSAVTISVYGYVVEVSVVPNKNSNLALKLNFKYYSKNTKQTQPILKSISIAM